VWFSVLFQRFCRSEFFVFLFVSARETYVMHNTIITFCQSVWNATSTVLRRND